MIELSRLRGSEGYGACSDEVKASRSMAFEKIVNFLLAHISE